MRIEGRTPSLFKGNWLIRMLQTSMEISFSLLARESSLLGTFHLLRPSNKSLGYY